MELKKFYYGFLLLFTLLIPNISHAAWSAFGLIEKLTLSNNGEWWVTLQGSMSNPLNCGNPDVYELTTSQSSNVEGRKNITAAAFYAKTTNKRIRFNLTSCSSTGRPQISTAEIE